MDGIHKNYRMCQDNGLSTLNNGTMIPSVLKYSNGISVPISSPLELGDIFILIHSLDACNQYFHQNRKKNVKKIMVV